MTAVISHWFFKNLPKLVNFCVAIFNIEDGRGKSNIFGISCFIISRRVKTQLKHKKICTVYGESAVTDRTCQKCFGKFCVLVNAPWLGRTVEVDSDQINTLIENNQSYIIRREITDLLKIYIWSIENHLHQLGYVNWCLRST